VTLKIKLLLLLLLLLFAIYTFIKLYIIYLMFEIFGNAVCVDFKTFKIFRGYWTNKNNEYGEEKKLIKKYILLK
jgi:hypothetical protein